MGLLREGLGVDKMFGGGPFCIGVVGGLGVQNVCD